MTWYHGDNQERKGFTSMKKRIFRAVIFMAAGLAFGGCSASGFPNLSTYVYDNADKYTMGNADLEADKIMSIDIDWVSGEVKIGYHSEDTVSISETADKALKDETTMYYYVDGDTLRVKFAKSGKSTPVKLNKELTVWLPEGMELKEVGVDSISADVSVSGITAERGKFNTISGDIAFEDVTCSGKVDFETTSGDITANFGGNLAELSADTVSGDIDLSIPGAEGLELDSTSGEIKLALQSLPDALSVDTISGDVLLCLPKDADFTIRLDTVSGSLDSELAMKKKGDDYVFGAGTKQYDVDTTSGDLKIEGK